MRVGAIALLTLALAACAFWMRVSAQSPDQQLVSFRGVHLNSELRARGVAAWGRTLPCRRHGHASAEWNIAPTGYGICSDRRPIGFVRWKAGALLRKTRRQIAVADLGSCGQRRRRRGRSQLAALTAFVPSTCPVIAWFMRAR